MPNTDYLKTAASGLTKPTDYLKQAEVAIQPGGQAFYDEINAYLATLSPADRANAIQAVVGGNPEGILGNMSLPSGVTNPLSVDQLKQLLDGIQKQYKPVSTQAPLTAQQTQAAAATTVQQTATTAATTATAQLPDFTAGETGAGIPVVGSSGSSIPGTSTPASFNNELQNYYSTEFSQAGSDPTALARLAGTTPQMLQQQYASYQQGWTKAQTQFRPGFVGGVEGGQQPMSLQEFAQNKAQSMVGPWASILDAISAIYQSQFQTALPPDLATQIITALNGMPQGQQSNVLYWASQYMLNKAQAISSKGLFDQTGTYASSLLGTLPSSILTYTGGSGTGTGSLGTGGIVGTYVQAHPSAFLQGETISNQIAQDFQNKLNRAPTAADFAALGKDPAPQEITAYIDNQPAPGAPGMTYGAYSSAVSSLTPMWQQYFGKDPSISELRWAVGKSPEDLQSFINNSSSSIPGVTIGQKNDYQTFIDGFDKGTGGGHGLSAGIDDSLIKDLHTQITKASTGTAKPGAM